MPWRHLPRQVGQSGYQGKLRFSNIRRRLDRGVAMGTASREAKASSCMSLQPRAWTRRKHCSSSPSGWSRKALRRMGKASAAESSEDWLARTPAFHPIARISLLDSDLGTTDRLRVGIKFEHGICFRSAGGFLGAGYRSGDQRKTGP